MNRCPFCKAEIEEQARFCLYCMKPLNQKETPPPLQKKKRWWPFVLLAVIMVLLLAASMSTLQSVVLTSASAVAVDFIPAVTKKEIEPKKQMLLTRIFCFTFVACSFIFATLNIPIIVSLMSFSWGVVSGCFIGPYLWGLFSKKTTKQGAYAGMIAGLVTVGSLTLIITLVNDFATAAKMSPEMGVLAMEISVIIVPIVSMLTRKKVSKEETERVEQLFNSCKEN